MNKATKNKEEIYDKQLERLFDIYAERENFIDSNSFTPTENVEKQHIKIRTRSIFDQEEINTLLTALNEDTIKNETVEKVDQQMILRTLWKIARKYKDQLSEDERKILFGEK